MRDIYIYTFQEIKHNPHLGKRKIVFKYALSGGYVNFLEGIYNIDRPSYFFGVCVGITTSRFKRVVSKGLVFADRDHPFLSDVMDDSQQISIPTLPCFQHR